MGTDTHGREWKAFGACDLSIKSKHTHTHISYQSNVDVRAHTGERWMEYETIILNIQFVFEFQY